MKLSTVIVFVCTCVIAVICAILYSTVQEDRAFNQREQEWVAFSQQHHCGIVQEASFFNPRVLWQCEGFQVSRFEH